MKHVSLEQDFVYSIESLMKERLVSTFFLAKKWLSAYEEKTGCSEKHLLKYDETAYFYA